MSEAGKARVKIDLKPIKKGFFQWDAYIDFNSLDQPDAITIVINGLGRVDKSQGF